MTFINWSDSEEMIGLLTEYVADERSASRPDGTREVFLAGLLQELTQLNEESATISTDRTIEMLRAIQDSVDPEFSEDPVLVHVEACIEELERIRMNESSDRKSRRGSGSRRVPPG
jgi:hypothetical protein